MTKLELPRSYHHRFQLRQVSAKLLETLETPIQSVDLDPWRRFSRRSSVPSSPAPPPPLPWVLLARLRIPMMLQSMTALPWVPLIGSRPMLLCRFLGFSGRKRQRGLALFAGRGGSWLLITGSGSFSFRVGGSHMILLYSLRLTWDPASLWSEFLFYPFVFLFFDGMLTKFQSWLFWCYLSEYSSVHCHMVNYDAKFVFSSWILVIFVVRLLVFR